MVDVPTLREIRSLKTVFEERASRAAGGPVRVEEYSSYAQQLSTVETCLQREQHAAAEEGLYSLATHLSVQASTLNFMTEDFRAQDIARDLKNFRDRIAVLAVDVARQEKAYARDHAGEHSALLLKAAENEWRDAPLGNHGIMKLVVAAAKHIARQDEEIKELRDKVAAMERTLAEPPPPLDKPRLSKPHGPE